MQILQAGSQRFSEICHHLGRHYDNMIIMVIFYNTKYAIANSKQNAETPRKLNLANARVVLSPDPLLHQNHYQRKGVRLFARRTFTTPKIRTFTTRTFPIPQKKTFARRTAATPIFFFFFLAHFSWLFRLTAHGGHQGWEGGGA